MKYIVLSFDDGLIDFKKNALPILEKHNLKASINVISGYVDDTIHQDYGYMSISDLNTLKRNGFELSVHSNSHSKPITLSDFLICKSKMESWFQIEETGAIIPFSQKIEESVFLGLKESGFKYIADYSKGYNLGRSFKAKLLRVFNHFKRKYYRDELVFFNRYFYKLPKKKEILLFERLPANRKHNPKMIKDAIGLMKNNTCLTIVFHSIIDNIDDCPWPFGAWTKNEFNDFIDYIVSRKKVKIVTQMELFNVEKD